MLQKNIIVLAGCYKKKHLKLKTEVLNNGTEEIALGRAQTRYLSSEVAGGFTGVLIGLYALGDNNVNFENFNCKYI